MAMWWVFESIIHWVVMFAPIKIVITVPERTANAVVFSINEEKYIGLIGV